MLEPGGFDPAEHYGIPSTAGLMVTPGRPTLFNPEYGPGEIPMKLAGNRSAASESPILMRVLSVWIALSTKPGVP